MASVQNDARVRCGLTSHVDVGGAPHVATGEDNQVEHVANDAQGTDNGQHEAVAVFPQGFGAGILDVLLRKKERKNEGSKNDCQVESERMPESETNKK